MAAKRSSLFGEAAPKGADETSPTSQAIARDLPQVAAGASEPAPAGRYPKAKTREGKRVATVYLEREALRQLQRIAFEEEITIQALLAEGINAVFERRGLSRIA